MPSNPTDNAAPALGLGNQAIVAAYFKLGLAAVFGLLLVLGVYFLVTREPSNNNIAQTVAVCRCPSCGMTVQKPAGMDCEEVNCPHCGSPMRGAAILAAQTPAQQPLNQNQRETLAEQGIVTPGPLNQNQRETLAEQGINPGANGQLPGANGALVALGQPNLVTNTCICPNCGHVHQSYPGIACGQMRCPVCGTAMASAIYVGSGAQVRNGLAPQFRQPIQQFQQPIQQQFQQFQQPMQQQFQQPVQQQFQQFQQPIQQPMQQFQQPMQQFQQPVLQAQPLQPLQVPGFQAQGIIQAAAPGPCPGGPGGLCPGAVQNPAPTVPAPSAGYASPANSITYSRHIQEVVASNCLRCHGGPLRNLSTYQNLKAYVDNGLLMMMVQPGGPMSRFLTADQAHLIILWIQSGAQP